MLKGTAFRWMVEAACLLVAHRVAFRPARMLLLTKRRYRRRLFELLLRDAEADTIRNEANAEKLVLENSKLALEIFRGHCHANQPNSLNSALTHRPKRSR